MLAFERVPVSPGDTVIDTQFVESFKTQGLRYKMAQNKHTTLTLVWRGSKISQLHVNEALIFLSFCKPSLLSEPLNSGFKKMCGGGALSFVLTGVREFFMS